MLPGLKPQLSIILITGFGFTAVRLISRTETQQRQISQLNRALIRSVLTVTNSRTFLYLLKTH